MCIRDRPLIAFGSGGVQAVGLESVGRVYVGRSYFGTAHAGTGRSGETNAHCREDGQYEYADPAIHIVKDNVIFRQNV